MSERPDIFIIAGEASGDMIASLLVKQLRRQRPDVVIEGLGGDQMAEAGATIHVNTVRDFAIIGVIEVIANFPRIRRLFNQTIELLRSRRPRVLVLIDYPGFNLRIARIAHRMGIKVVYYVIPQVWAWHKSRVHQIRKFTDKALVIFPFEETMLREHGAEVEYVGHPLLDVMILTMGPDQVFDRFELNAAAPRIGLLPGSRKREIDALLPVMLGAAEVIRRRIPDAQFILPKAPTITREHIDRHLRSSSIEVKVIEAFRYNVRATLDFALVASGTATLETGLLLCPMVILYKVAPLTAFLARLLLKLQNIGLINIVAGERVVPELLQNDCTAEAVARESLQIILDPGETLRIREKLKAVKEKMGGRGASRRAAEIILEVRDSVP